MLKFDMEVRLFDLVICLSDAADLVSQQLVNHHKQTAYISWQIGEAMGLPRQELLALALAGMVHDMGALPLYESLDNLLLEKAELIDDHARLGQILLSSFEPLSHVAKIVRHHHAAWNDGRGRETRVGPVPKESFILYLADRISVSIKPGEPILGQSKQIRESIREKMGSVFWPEAVEAFEEHSAADAFWFDAISPNLGSLLRRSMRTTTIELDMEGASQIAEVFAKVIDFRSRFTATHSAGVAASSVALAKSLGFAKRELKMMGIAGLLHDLGKLSVPTSILEKPGKLSPEEFDVIRGHTYHTFRILETVRGFETINNWAAFHHERLDEKGYPFRVVADELTLGSRIMAIADVFTALTEDRPYREGMTQERTLSILDKMVAGGALDGDLVSVLEKQIEEIDEARKKAQTEAASSFASQSRTFEAIRA